MTLIDELKVMNYSMIDCLKANDMSIKKNKLIKEILKDEACFFKIEKEEAFVVLKNLKVADDMLEETYKELTSRQEFDRLCNKGIINENDKNLKVKYEMYNNDLFKSKAQEITETKKEDVALVETNEEKWYQKILSFLHIKVLIQKIKRR